jgi:hypothetical protein
MSREPVAWSWCNLAASQRRHYCPSVNSHSSVGLVSRQWDARWLTLCVVWLSRLQWPGEQISFITTMRLTILKISCSLFFGKTSHHPGLSAPLHPKFGFLRFLVYSKAKIAVEREEKICECDSPTVHKLSQRRLTADWLASRDSECWWMRSKVSSDGLPSYIKVRRPVLEIFKMAGYFSDSPRNLTASSNELIGSTEYLTV